MGEPLKSWKNRGRSRLQAGLAGFEPFRAKTRPLSCVASFYIRETEEIEQGLPSESQGTPPPLIVPILLEYAARLEYIRGLPPTAKLLLRALSIASPLFAPFLILVLQPTSERLCGFARQSFQLVSTTMDIILELTDTFLFDHLYAWVLPAHAAPFRFSDHLDANATGQTFSAWQYKPATSLFSVEPSQAAYASAWARDNIFRQTVSLFLITWYVRP